MACVEWSAGSQKKSNGRSKKDTSPKKGNEDTSTLAVSLVDAMDSEPLDGLDALRSSDDGDG
jgi:hypothetical protein